MTIVMIVVVLLPWFVSRIPERNKDAKNVLYLPDNPQEKKFCQKSYSFKQVFESVAFCLMAVILASMHIYYDYIGIKKDQIELEGLRRQTREQRVQIDGLLEKINDFAMKMEEHQAAR